MKRRKVGKRDPKLENRGTGKNGGRRRKEGEVIDPSQPLKDQRQETFCLEYLKEPIGQVAAEIAGYSHRTARHQACRLLTRDNIKNRLEFLRSKIQKKFDIESEWVLLKLQTLATSARRESDRIRCLELIGKYFALFTDKVKHEGLPKRIVVRNENGKIEEEIK